MADCNAPQTLSNVAKRDVNRLVGTVAKTLAANSPFIGVLRGGTFAANQGDVVTSSVEMQAAPGDSLAVPTFADDTSMCGTQGLQDLTGKVDFTYRLQSKRGTGPRVCVKQGQGSFKSSYLTAEDALRKLVTQYINADIQAQLVLRSASKVQTVSGNSLENIFLGGTEADVNQPFDASLVIDSPLSFKALHAIARFLKEALFGEMFDASGKGSPHFRFIGSSDIIESFRSEVGVENILIALTQGGYKLGEQSLSAYSFEQSPAYRGLAFGVTQRPLRFDEFGTGPTENDPQWLNPVEIVSDSETNTAYAVASQDWLAAGYEVGILLADGSFERQVPERYVGEGSFKFAPQLHMGELDWHYQLDNDCNQWGDFGWHKFQISRAYKPLRPQHAIAIAYKRCAVDLGLNPCSESA